MTLSLSGPLWDTRHEGLIVVGPEVDGHRLEPIAEEVPVVEVGRSVTRGPVDVVRNDDALGTRQAVDHLVDLGRRSIAFIGGGGNPGAQDRQSGYTEDEGANAAQLLLADRLPTAVIASNDLAAIGLLDSMLRAGVRVPEDLSVIGNDDSRFARLPGIDLTSVRQDVPRMAELAVQAVVERPDSPPRKPKDVALPPQMVVRGTTSPPP